MLLGDAVAKAKARAARSSRKGKGDGEGEGSMLAGVRKRVDVRDGGSGATPLMIAVRGGHVEAARMLLEGGADCLLREGPGGDGMSALDMAVAARDPDILKLLQDCDGERRGVRGEEL